MNNNSIPFLDTIIHITEPGNIKVKVYRKPTHNDQYLNLNSHHPIQHKLSVVRTLLERKATVTTKDEDKKIEEERVRRVLTTNGYPEWTIRNTKTTIENNVQYQCKKKKQKDKTEKPKGHITLPYVKGMSERLRRVCIQHNIGVIFKPHKKLRQIIIHPKDKISIDEKCGVVYEVPCSNCDQVYIGETGRKLSTRIAENKKDVETHTTTGVRTRKKDINQLHHPQVCHHRPCRTDKPCPKMVECTNTNSRSRRLREKNTRGHLD